jgi:hypothetical protein
MSASMRKSVERLSLSVGPGDSFYPLNHNAVEVLEKWAKDLLSSQQAPKQYVQTSIIRVLGGTLAKTCWQLSMPTEE